MQHLHFSCRLAVVVVASAAALFAATGSAAAQSSAAGAKIQPGVPATAALAAARRRITIDVTATDKQGNPIRGLQAQDFTLFDNQQPQKLLAFQAIDATATTKDSPVHIVVVLDNINSTFDTVAREREELDLFLKENNGQLAHPTSVAVMADSGLKVESGSTLDGNALLASLNHIDAELRIVGRGTGFYGAAERLEMSLNQLSELAAFESTLPGRKMLLVVSPGWPMLAWAGFQADLHEREWVFQSVVALTNGLREGHITLYSLEPFELGRVDPFYYEDYLKGVAKVDDADYPDLALQVLAEHTGGLVLVTGNDITHEVETAVGDAAAYYELTFNAPPGTQPDEYHALSVKVDKPGITARTTTGYYTDTDTPPPGESQKTTGR